MQIHHIAAIASDLNKTIDFYGSILGFRVLHRTSPHGGPRVCHFHWDEELRNFLTFYHCPGLQRGRAGINMVHTASFSVNLSSLGFWVDRLNGYQVAFKQVRDLFSNEIVLCFEDPDGLSLELVFTINDNRIGVKTGNVPGCFSIKGLHKVEIASGRFPELAELLSAHFRLKHIAATKKRHRFALFNRPGSIIDVQDSSWNMHGASGCGLIHHVAICMQDHQAYVQLSQQVAQSPNKFLSYKQHRHFASFYYREAEGILFEVLTQKDASKDDCPNTFSNNANYKKR
jgi:glyoxalase family protein